MAGGHTLEGAVYAETIPFSETRDYVKKVMTNAAYYASLFGAPHIPLKQRMGDRSRTLTCRCRLKPARSFRRHFYPERH